MISRKTTKLIADAYAAHFKTALSRDGIYTLKQEEINTFLYEQEYEYAFLKIVRETVSSDNHKRLAQAIMGLHTGETIAGATRGSSDSERQAIGQTFLTKLAEDILNLYETLPVYTADGSRVTSQEELEILKTAASYNRPAARILCDLISRLEIDGYLYRDGHLYSTESSVIDERAEQDYLVGLTDLLNLPNATVIKHHLELSEEHYVNRKYDDSISNSRKVLDAILKQLTETIYQKVKGTPPPPALLKNATDIRVFLEKQGLITTPERETLEKTYGLLSVTGGHPYIAEKDQARLMRHLALTFSQFILLRYQGFVANNP